MALTRALSLELARSAIQVNAISPIVMTGEALLDGALATLHPDELGSEVLALMGYRRP